MEYGRTPSQFKDPLPKESVEKAACVLAWTITRSSQAVISNAQLKALHHEIEVCAEMVGAVQLEVGAIHGLLWCRTESKAVSAEDSAVRLGQLLCWWAADQDPEIGLRIGVHTAELRTIELPGQSMPGYLGQAVIQARHLAESAPRETCVHFLPITKRSLRIFERVPFSVWWNRFRTPATDSYYLDPWTETTALDGQDLQSVWEVQASRCSLIRLAAPSWTGGQISEAINGMSVEDFKLWLASFGVDVSAFGKGHAKSLEEFHREIVQEKKSYLVEKESILERRLELVRINLYAKDASGEDRYLKLAMEVLDDGRTRPRNQKLAVVVHEGESWRQAVERTFSERFQIVSALKQNVFRVEGNWYKEERVMSPSIPGIVTTYLTHEVRIRVDDVMREELKGMGLPEMKNFSTSGESLKRSHWMWTVPGDEVSNADVLAQLLQDHGISMEEFAPGAFNDLLDEVYETKASTLSVRDGELLRDLHVIKVWLTTDILSVPHVLLATSKVHRGRRDEKNRDCPVSMRMPNGQSWQEALKIALSHRLGLDDGFQNSQLVIDRSSYRMSEEIEYSRSFPGLKTMYHIHEVTCRVTPTLKHGLLGLPDGSDFAFARQERSKDGTTDDAIITYFSWRPRKDCRPTIRRPKALSGSGRNEDEDSGLKEDPKRRLPAPAPLSVPSKTANTSSCLVEELMRGRKTDWDRAWNAARRIRDKAYTCGQFFKDCTAAFPELSLYVPTEGASTTASSGRSLDDEYQRTMGALFAVYWLMRLDLDGAQSFSFGVDSDWTALSSSSARPRRTAQELQRRSTFLEQATWSQFQRVLIMAGLLRGDGPSALHDEERTVAMLVLTAIHDIMKVQSLLPTVDRRGPFSGYKPGEVIHDHDIALGYVLERHPDALPSFAGLPKAQQETVKFTQCNMEYNMGWLVQAEAPPGALFTKFKAAIRSGSAKPSDVAFYFTHWLTDLAGAEPFPQEGCEKFVLKFPLKVLGSFLHSFPFVLHLSTKSETNVFEDYLEWRWTTHEPALGPPPLGPGSIAKLRLVVMAQGNSQRVLEALEELPAADREVLDEELARCGCRDQAYARNNLKTQGGPAFLIYYGPALLQKNCGADPVGALAVLAELLRQARVLWPLEDTCAAEVVTIQIDSLKDLEVQSLQELPPGEFWMLQRVNRKEAQVMRTNFMALAADGTRQVDWSIQRILNFGTAPAKAMGQDFLHGLVDASAVPAGTEANKVRLDDPYGMCECGCYACPGCSEGMAPGYFRFTCA